MSTCRPHQTIPPLHLLTGEQACTPLLETSAPPFPMSQAPCANEIHHYAWALASNPAIAQISYRLSLTSLNLPPPSSRDQHGEYTHDSNEFWQRSDISCEHCQLHLKHFDAAPFAIVIAEVYIA